MKEKYPNRVKHGYIGRNYAWILELMSWVPNHSVKRRLPSPKIFNSRVSNTNLDLDTAVYLVQRNSGNEGVHLPICWWLVPGPRHIVSSDIVLLYGLVIDPWIILC